MIKWRGISVSIHPLFSFTLLLSILTGSFLEVTLLFTLVLIHEWGHVVAARSLGWKVIRVQILPFGGVAEMEEHFPPLWEEVVVALAGPAQNFWLIGLGWMMMELQWWGEAWGMYVIEANLMIALFNFIPIAPLDGGKLLQAGFSRLFAFHQALIWTAGTGLLLSGLLILFAMYSLTIQAVSPHLWMIALFLFVSNYYALKHVPYRFMRFLIARGREPRTVPERRKTGFKREPSIYVDVHTPVEMAVRQLRRDPCHLIYVYGPQGHIQHVMKEHKLIEWFFDPVWRKRTFSQCLP
ncbi:M50 family metallopeptidase [Marinicrinis sediminis]|uniref:M50 family metallopeptidase n=1 Tax=Marinicrinis sediminis TaxID=1652465 RepID=A0ABW5R620_9BACL